MEVTLYNPSGGVTAYIDIDDDYTICLWDGTPVAYIDGENVYGFNGRHLGWFEEGLLRDRYGHGIGFTKETCPSATSDEPVKGPKQAKPSKSGPEIPPMKPLYGSTASDDDFELFLRQGR